MNARPIYQARSAPRTGPAQLKRTQMKRSRSKRPAHLVDRHYSAWIHTQACCAADLSPCRGRMTQHHKREDVGIARKAHDHESISLCAQHHLIDLDGMIGAFKAWTRQMVRDFVNSWIVKLRAKYLALTDGAPMVAAKSENRK